MLKPRSKIKVALYSGRYPDTTFLTLLTEQLSKEKEIALHIFGKKTSNNPPIFQNTTYHFIPSSRFLLVFYTLWHAILTFLFRKEHLLSTFSKVSKEKSSLKKKFHLLSKLLPIVYYKPDIIHLQWIHSYDDLKYLMGAGKKKLMVSLRGRQLSVTSFTSEKGRKISTEALIKADIIHSISDDLTKQALELVPKLSKSKIVKINPAINPANFPHRPTKNRQSTTLTIITVCRLNWKKGLLYGLQAVKQLKEMQVKVHWRILGSGPQYEELKFLIYSFGLEDYVVLEGNVEHKRLHHYFKDADLFLLPSVQEGFSNAVLEAQATGLPCLVSDAEGLPENVEHGVTGYVFKKRNPDEIVDAILNFNSLSEHEFSKMQTAAQNRARSKFSLSKQIEQFVTIYKELHNK